MSYLGSPISTESLHEDHSQLALARTEVDACKSVASTVENSIGTCGLSDADNQEGVRSAGTIDLDDLASYDEASSYTFPPSESSTEDLASEPLPGAHRESEVEPDADDDDLEALKLQQAQELALLRVSVDSISFSTR